MENTNSDFIRAETALDDLVVEWRLIVDKLEKSGDLKTLCVSLFHLNQQYEKINLLRKEMGELYDRMNEGIVPKAFEDAGCDKFAIPELARSFYPLPKYSASIVNNDQALAWLRKNGMESLIYETVNRQTLAAVLRGRLVDEGRDPPESMKLEKYVIVGSSKYTPKGK